MAEIVVTSENFDQEVANSEVPVLVDFWAEWCGPCKMVGPIIEEIASNTDDKFKVGKVNVDEQMELATKYKISSIPAIYLFKGDKVIDAIIGFAPKERIMAMVNKHI
ncbi:MAG: thioredoxin [Clostridia bacterium]|nr:thioredoxin [Clostridia bacterium]